MAVKTGRNAKITVNDVTVARITAYTFDQTSEQLGDFEFGNNGRKTYAGAGGIDAVGTIDFMVDIADTTGQNVLELAYKNNTALTQDSGNQFKMYITDTDFWTTVSGNNVYITSYKLSLGANELTRGSLDFVCDGEMERTT